MRIFISNFLRRAADWLHRNRAKLIKLLLIAAAAILAFVVIRTAVEEWQRSKYEKRVEAMEAQVRDADARAQEAERQADILKNAIEAKYAQLRAIQERAETAETALRNARGKVVTLKETYEEVRNTPMPAADVSCATACADLAAVGYECK